MTKRISIVIPVFREGDNLLRLYERLEGVTSAQASYEWEYIFVNDGSPDNSLDVLLQLSRQDIKVKVLDLSRNFGKEIALTAGVHDAGESDAVICIDADLQHPPELIPKLIEKWEQGVEIVATNRLSIDKQPLLRRIGSHCFYWIMNKISEVDMSSQTTDFRLFDKKVVEIFNQITERERMFRGIFDWMGFKKDYVDFHADAREAGEAGYSYSKLIALATNAMTSFSLFPLRLTGYLGIFISVLSFILLVCMSITWLFVKTNMFTPMAFFMVANTMLIGIVLMAIGLVALYIGNIHTEVVNRPLYIIREKISFRK